MSFITIKLHILTFILLSCVTLTSGQEKKCYECEEYLGNYCQCNRYDTYWNVDKRLYGISECIGLTQVMPVIQIRFILIKKLLKFVCICFSVSNSWLNGQKRTTSLKTQNWNMFTHNTCTRMYCRIELRWWIAVYGLHSKVQTWFITLTLIAYTCDTDAHKARLAFALCDLDPGLDSVTLILTKQAPSWPVIFFRLYLHFCL